MTAPMRPDPVADYLTKYGPKPQSPAVPAGPADPVAHYLATYGPKAPTSQDEPGVLSRASSIIGQVLTHPVDAIESAIVAPVKSAFTAVVAPGVGEARPDARLSKGGNSSGRAIDTTPYDAAHGAVTDDERRAAGAQTLTNLVLPGMARGGNVLARVAGTVGGGALAGAAYNPDDMAAGALSGAILAPTLSAAGHALRGAGSAALDVAGRPAETTPVLVRGMRLGEIQSAPDRAAAINARVIGASPSTNGMSETSTKPVTPMDVAGTAGIRAARGLKVSSPAAESVITDALKGRADNAVDRVIQHGLETTGLSSRENGLQVVDDMIAQRTQHGNENYQPVFAKYTEPLADPEFNAIAKTPAGQQVLKRAGVLAANRFDPIASTETPAPAAAFDPSSLSGKQADLYAKLLEHNGYQVAPALAAMKALGYDVAPEASAPVKQIAPTLKQAHYVKLAFDDMLSSAPEPGTGGLGPNNASAIRDLKGRWLAAMDRSAPEYQQARQTYADESELVRGAQLGRNLWKLHPDEAAKALKELPSAAQEVARRTGFDALAERIENGPTDVERGVSKPRDMKRMRLLFPDDASFESFKQGLAEEARLHANEQAVLGGSNTADKLADMANMAGVTLPDVVRAAATGRWHGLIGRGAANVTRKLLSTSSDALAVERAKQLTAGANGDAAARSDALGRIRGTATPKAAGPQGFENAVGQAFYDYYAKRGKYLPATATRSDRSSR